MYQDYKEILKSNISGKVCQATTWKKEDQYDLFQNIALNILNK